MDKIAARIGIANSAAEVVRIHNEALRSQLVRSAAFDQAYELAQAARQHHLDDYLDNLEISVGPLTDKMLYQNSLDSSRWESYGRLIKPRNAPSLRTKARRGPPSSTRKTEAQEEIAVLDSTTTPTGAELCRVKTSEQGVAWTSKSVHRKGPGSS
jgi:hypothetical protein